MKYWLVVPAAGVGSRFGSSLPKQYSPLLGKTVIEHCLERLLAIPCEAIIVALHSDDHHWQHLKIPDSERIRRVEGGEQRADSVQRALVAIEAEAGDEDWVLVHDVVRPCVSHADLTQLIGTLAESPVGGLLATPVNATLKRIVDNSEFGSLGDAPVGDGLVRETVSREGLWLAATPQMFRYGPLVAALNYCLDHSVAITDEAEAMELAGHSPIIVHGRSDNIKITHADDLALAEQIIQAQAQAQAQAHVASPVNRS